MKKKILFIFLVIFILAFLLPRSQKIHLGKMIKSYTPISVYSSLKFIFDNSTSIKKLSNDYNVTFLPNTQNEKIDFKQIKLEFLNEFEGGYLDLKKSYRKTFFLEIFKSNLYVLSNEGNIYFSNIEDILSEKINFEKIDTNLTFINRNQYSFDRVLDFEVFQNKIFVSKVIKDKDCYYMLVDYAILNEKILNFKNIFSTVDLECAKKFIQAGKIEILNNNLLLTTAADMLVNEDESDPKPQNDNSIYGKLLSINLENNNFEIFNKGHRNSLGLLVDQNLILSTENGPKGGDEINVELKGENYGWDIASYGKKYYSKFNYVDHEQFGFKEPLFVFIPSIGISEIIKLDNRFSDKWNDNYLIGSLFGNHLLRVKLNNKASKVMFVEKIFIGDRIRDLVYDKISQTVFLALENNGSIGYLRKSNN